ncbi:MAG TPA: PilZ domain-containing protein [Candidatus Acidoferrales bacterium]|nr:PilZ domain-containing protein [Candidatus Acidoferrales bacterium]
MNLLEQEILEQEICTSATESDESVASERFERRGAPRAQVDRLVYVQPADQGKGHFEEVRSMRDLSRSGFYFTTERNCYAVGNQLHVIPAFGSLNLEYLGEVVRVENLRDGEIGVAIRLIRVQNMAGANRSNALSAFEAFTMADGSAHAHAPRNRNR